MRHLILTSVALGIVCAAAAHPGDLGGGCFIAHYCEPLGYSSDPPALGWCEEYFAEYRITWEDQQVNRIDVATVLPASWFVIAAWTPEDKIWCGTEFGLGDYDPNLFTFVEYNCCFPPDGGLEIPTAGWPGPNEGIAFVVTGQSWEGDFIPVMHFGGYAYGQYGEGLIPLGVDPATDFAGFSNCDAPPIPFDAEQLGAMGINRDGYYAHPISPPSGACCLSDGSCLELTLYSCVQMDGEWLGAHILCEPNPCIPPPVGACCLLEPLGACQVLSEEECLLVNGDWQGPETVCEPNPCTHSWVCCVGCDCYIVETQTACEQGLGGVFHPEWSTCTPNPCEDLTPARDTSWGTIKSMYR